jgi:DNA-binding response OmpR family regulator
LLLEDNPGDARLVREILSDSSLPIELSTSGCLTDSVRRLETETHDVILVDLGLPDASALEAVSEVARLAPRSCLIVLTGRDDDATAMEALNKGAQDYLIKGKVDAAILARSIRFARERQRTVNLRAELLEAIAHELRNPIHVVLGYAHLLLEKIPDPLTPDQAQILGNVLATTRTLRRLSDAMLDLAGAEKGPLREELRNADAAEVIDELKRRMMHLLAVAGERDPVLAKPIATGQVNGGKPPGPGRLFRRMLRRLGKQPKQVLLIDPDYDSRTIIRTALESGAFQVVESCKESEVLDHLVSDKIALAVFERHTPDLAAPQVFDHVRRVAAYCDIPVLMLDADGRQNHRAPEYRISKPFTPEQLLFAVDHALGRA